VSDQNVDLHGFYNPIQFGAPLFPSSQNVPVTGMASTLRFGGPLLLGGSRAYPVGMPSTLVFGLPNVSGTELTLPFGWELERYAELPFYEAQRKLRDGQVGSTRIVGSCGWHGRNFDARRGCYALAHPDGPFAGLVGERVQVSAPGSSKVVYVLVVDTDETLEELSLTRRSFLALGLLTTDELEVTVRVVEQAESEFLAVPT